MKTFADLRRRMVVGARLRAVEHWQEKLIGTVRTVTKAQTNGYWYRLDGDSARYWSGYDAAACFSFPTPDQYRFELSGRGWTLEFC